jgi:hypothetical protein
MDCVGSTHCWMILALCLLYDDSTVLTVPSIATKLEIFHISLHAYRLSAQCYVSTS